GTLDADGNPGFRLFVGGGLGSAPREADLLEPFTPPELLLPTTEAILQVFHDHGERRNRVRARMKFLVSRWGIDRFREEVLALRAGRAADGRFRVGEVPVADPRPVEGVALPPPTAVLEGGALQAYTGWRDRNVFAHASVGGPRYAATATFPLGDVTATQLRA